MKAMMQSKMKRGVYTVEKVRVVFRWVPVELPDVEQIVILPMDISANCEPFAVWDGYINQRRQPLEDMLYLRATKRTMRRVAIMSSAYFRQFTRWSKLDT
jgi:hypothetical protein